MKLKFNNLVKGIALLLFFVAFSNTSFAQRTVTGTVTDGGDGEPLIGASILVSGTSSGTVTDIDGTYSINVPSGATELEVSYTGYATQNITLGASNVVDVALSAGSVLDEVVVVGYGSAKRSDVTGSVASIEEKDFNQGIVVSPDQLIQGRVAGVNIINNSGQPGGDATIKIRGNSSIRAGAEPLYVIDGVPLDGRSARAGLIAADFGDQPSSNPLNFLNPSDISNISVLKDASSAAIYGSRGANGVVIVTTKKGRSQEPTIDFGASLGTSSILKRYDVLDAASYRNALSDYNIPGNDGGANVDAFDEILQNGITQRYNLSIGGGSKNGNYRVSLGVHDQEGIIKESGIKRYNAALNSNYTFFDDRAGLDIFIITAHSREDIAPISSNPGFTGNLVGQALQWNPTVPLITNGQPTSPTNNDSGAAIAATTINPLLMLEAHSEIANVTTLLGSLSPYVNLTDNLQYRYRYGINRSNGYTRGGLSGALNLENVENLGTAGYSNTQLSSQLHTHTLQYSDDLSDNLTFTGLIGYEYQDFEFRGNGMYVRGFDLPNNPINVNSISNSDTQNRQVGSFAERSELQSFFARADFGVNDKYLLTATVRADGSTKFGDNNKYGVFPSVAAAWNLHNEDFLADGPFDQFKLRLGWGQTGNQSFPNGASQGTYVLRPDLQGARESRGGNADLRWETSTTTNVGVDFALFDYALSGTIEYFSRVTTDLLLDPFVSEPGPSETRVWQNIDGEVVNSGVELGLTAYVVDNENAQISIGFNAALINNEFRDYDGADLPAGELFGQGASGAFVQVMTDGQPLNSFYTREFTGLDDAGFNTFANNEAPTFLGDPNADIIMGFNLNGTFGDFSVGMNFNGAFGHQIYNNTAHTVIGVPNLLGGRNVDSRFLEGPITEDVTNSPTASSRYIEDADFLKLANATLAYRIGDLGDIKNINISLTGQNLFVITDYSGFDPEVNTVNLRNGIPSNGIEYIPYPSARNIILGVTASF